MEIANIFYKGKWYEVGDFIWLTPFKRWQIIEVIDSESVLIERKNKLKKLEARVRVYTI
jgi:hypothetical protein